MIWTLITLVTVRLATLLDAHQVGHEYTKLLCERGRMRVRLNEGEEGTQVCQASCGLYNSSLHRFVHSRNMNLELARELQHSDSLDSFQSCCPLQV